MQRGEEDGEEDVNPLILPNLQPCPL
jgi:hypothetical protein